MSPLSEGATCRAGQGAVVPAQSKKQSGDTSTHSRKQSGKRQGAVVPPHSKTIPGQTKVYAGYLGDCGPGDAVASRCAPCQYPQVH